LVAGCAIWGAGIDLTVKSHLGVAPWEIFQVAVNELSGISLGRVGQLIGLVLVVITFLAAHIKPRWGTLITLFLVGSFVDIWYPYVPEVQPLAGQVLMLLAGIGMIGLATGLYLKANLGAGPRDAAMFAICKLTGRSVRFARTSLEVLILVVGTLMGGPFGVGTIVYALTIGPVVQFSLRLLRVEYEPLWKDEVQEGH
jgi:uncharacterized membrane protein YczE